MLLFFNRLTEHYENIKNYDIENVDKFQIVFIIKIYERSIVRFYNLEVLRMYTGTSMQYQDLIKDDRVHTSLYTYLRIFDEEMEKIWYSGWVYVGHESEIANPRDYCTKQVGLQPVIFSRDSDGKYVY